MVRRHFLSGETTVRFAVLRVDLSSSRWVEVAPWAARRSSWGGRAPGPCARARRGPRRPDLHAGVYDMRDGIITDILPRRLLCDGAAPTTWLFGDADGLFSLLKHLGVCVELLQRRTRARPACQRLGAIYINFRA
jgi:hypothetical protein